MNKIDTTKKLIYQAGFAQTILVIFKKIIIKASKFPSWIFFRFANLKIKVSDPHSSELLNDSQKTFQKESVLRQILSSNTNLSFLEIGIGPHPEIDRLKLIEQQTIKYTAVDFSNICQWHKQIIQLNFDTPERFNFFGNQIGTYAWTLFNLLQKGKKFDIIYLDGHHTFYVDLPTMFIADLLLKDGGLFIIDDIQWNLNFLKKHMARSFNEYAFYRNIYEFSDYTNEQLEMPHMKIISEEILIKQLHYRKVEKYSSNVWWVLIK